MQDSELGPRASLSQALGEQLCAVFNLGVLDHASDLGGTYNLNALLVTSAGRYVGRVYRPWVSAERLKSIQQVRRSLVQQGLPIPQPLATSSGETRATIEGRLIEIEPYVTHDAIADTWERYAKAFTFLGTLHDALAGSVPPQFVPPRVSNYGLPSQLLQGVRHTRDVLEKENALPAVAQALTACQEAQDLLLVIDAWWKQASSSLPVQLLHGDYGGGNILLQNENIVAILDFDFLAVHERVFELAYTSYWTLKRLELGISPTGFSWDKLANLLSLYNHATSRPLTAQEWAALPLEMARVPLYWFAEAGFTPQPLKAVQAMIPSLSFARWLLDHADGVSRQLSL